MITGCKCVRLSTCVPLPLLILPVCFTALSVLRSVCRLYDTGGAVMGGKKTLSVQQYALRWRPVWFSLVPKWFPLVGNRWQLVGNRWRLVGN